jgi:hypothetical protein
MKPGEEFEKVTPVQNFAQRNFRLIIQVISKGIMGSIVVPLLSGIATYRVIVEIINWTVFQGHIKASSAMPLALAGMGTSLLIAFLVRTSLRSVK